MKSARILMALALVLAVAVVAAVAPRVDAQGQTIKIGVLYDHSGPFSAAGSLNCWRGAKMLIDYVNDQCHMLTQSCSPQMGVPDEVVAAIARCLVDGAFPG